MLRGRPALLGAANASSRTARGAVSRDDHQSAVGDRGGPAPRPGTACGRHCPPRGPRDRTALAMCASAARAAAQAGRRQRRGAPIRAPLAGETARPLARRWPRRERLADARRWLRVFAAHPTPTRRPCRPAYLPACLPAARPSFLPPASCLLPATLSPCLPPSGPPSFVDIAFLAARLLASSSRRHTPTHYPARRLLRPTVPGRSIKLVHPPTWRNTCHTSQSQRHGKRARTGKLKPDGCNKPSSFGPAGSNM